MVKPALHKPEKKASPLKSVKIEDVGYKDIAAPHKFISDHGRIHARHVTGVTIQE